MNVPLEGLLPASPLLTIEEAAKVLRIGRSLAYQLAAEYTASGERSGLPCTHIGGCLRVPRWALIVLVTTGQVVPLHSTDVAAVLRGAVLGAVGRDN
jgi:hypothetical protein